MGQSQGWGQPLMCQRVVVLGLVCVLVAGCGGDTSDDPRPEGGTSPTIVPGSGAHGTCWQIPPALVADDHYWHDDSPVVPCTEPHTTETVFVYELARPIPSAALEISDQCHD